MSEDLTEKQKRVSFRNKISLTLKLILVLIILNYNLYFANAFIIRDSFKFCEIHENRAIWDLPNSCQTETMTIGTTTQERGYYVLNQLTNMVNGKGWRCSKKEHVVETFKNFVFATSEIEYETYIHLSREDCQRMVETKTCENNEMKCNGNYCGFSSVIHPKEYEYGWMRTTNYRFIQSKI